jgi:hypothetical protein
VVSIRAVRGAPCAAGAVTLDCGALDRVRPSVGSFDVDDIVEPVEPFGEPARQAMLR